MIIECINCSKKFNVDSSLIPSEGRNIQCGSCNHTWYFKKEDQKEIFLANNEAISKKTKTTKNINIISPKTKQKSVKKELSITKTVETDKTIKRKNFTRSIFSIGNFFSFIIISMISFVALIIV